MPELPEVESARAALERAALNRRIGDVDDSDTYVCRPHAPGEIRAALVGRSLTAANRQGKSIWCDTSGLGRSHTPGPELAIHLGMSGHILVTYADGELTEGGDWLATEGRRAAARNPKNPAWDRFTITFEDGGQLRLFDPRRLGRVRLDADRERLGPDAQHITLRRVPRAAGPRSRRRQGSAAGPVRHRGRREPARRRDPVAGADLARRPADELAPTSWPTSAVPSARPPGAPATAAACIPARS